MTCLSILVCALGLSSTQVDTTATQLAHAIVSAVRLDAGLDAKAKRKPVSGGPFVIDDVSFQGQFDRAFGVPSGTDVINDFRMKGYAFGDIKRLQKTDKASNGRMRDSLKGDAFLVRLVALVNNEPDATAIVRYYYTRKNQICAKTLRFDFNSRSGSWELQKSVLQSQC